MNKKGSVLQYFAWVGQFGFTMILPPVLAAGAAWWLKERFALGNWIVFIALLLGVGASARNLVRFLRFVQQEAEHDRESRP